ncbi:MAG: hypothetical protein JWO43_42 [Candidatus Adlerbacteria bacterium]|nr:hypothetical protein [Candidatus Adlerbacteria bacterium]
MLGRNNGEAPLADNTPSSEPVQKSNGTYPAGVQAVCEDMQKILASAGKRLLCNEAPPETIRDEALAGIAFRRKKIYEGTIDPKMVKQGLKMMGLEELLV